MLTSHEIRSATFSRTRWGRAYDPAEVDSFIHDLAFALETNTDVVPLDILAVKFTRARVRDGYRRADVDRFLKRIAKSLK